MYDKINITENILRTLSLFTNGFDRGYYVREVEKLLGTSPRTAQLSLENLEGKGVLESEVRGKIKSYNLKLNETTKRYLIFTEQYKEISFLENKPLIKEILDKLKPFVNGTGIVFGSYVKQMEDKESDLDIFIIGSYNSEKFKQISEDYGLEINVKIYPKKIFEQNKGKDFLLIEILKNHVIFSGVESFINMVIKNG